MNVLPSGRVDIVADSGAAAQEARSYLDVVTDTLKLDDDEVGYVIGKSGRQVCKVVFGCTWWWDEAAACQGGWAPNDQMNVAYRAQSSLGLASTDYVTYMIPPAPVVTRPLGV